ncbi:glycosyltransferase family 2 protein [Micrococcus terreus]|uniref:glycosyltransferase family 2 protein n=1 Tax=Micrococcus terreus TaxID=574650 RepID=UPI003D757792
MDAVCGIRRGVSGLQKRAYEVLLADPARQQFPQHGAEPGDDVVGGLLQHGERGALQVGGFDRSFGAGFDRSFGAGHEEADFAWRVQRAGGRLVWCPDAVVHYRQRAGANRAFRQWYHYARSAILLWTRFEDTGELTPVSFRGSVRNLARQALRSYRLIIPRTRHEHALALGWTAGTVMGHLRYRRQAPPQRELMEPPTA